MRKSMITFVAIILLALPAMAETTCTYDWGVDADYLGCFNVDMSGSIDGMFNRPSSAGNGLQLTKNTYGGYAVGFLAAVWDLQEGDEVTASVWRYDNQTGMPYFNLWSHYNDSLGEAEDARGQDMAANDGMNDGDTDLGVQDGWELYEWTWTVEAGHTGMIIDAWIYGSRGSKMYVDDLSITVPSHASVRTPDAIYPAYGSPVGVEAASWSGVKSLFQ